jgi:glycosyltransferase involved in cell wall biosynthesis
MPSRAAHPGVRAPPGRSDRLVVVATDGHNTPVEPQLPALARSCLEPSVDHNAKHLAIVPAYNEAATVGDVVRSLHAHVPDFDVLVIDDGSTDGTGDVARAAGARTLTMPFNLGIGGAVQAGFVYAVENGYDYVLQFDADGQHIASEIAHLRVAMAEDPSLDMVCGSRFLSAEHGYPAPVSRRTGIHLFAFLLSRIIGQRVSDPTSGFRLYNRRGIALFARDYPHDYPEVEAVVMLHYHRLRMREVPVTMRPRGGGRSSIASGKSLYYMVKVLLAIFIGLARRRPTPEPGDEAPVAAVQNI